MPPLSGWRVPVIVLQVAWHTRRACGKSQWTHVSFFYIRTFSYTFYLYSTVRLATYTEQLPVVLSRLALGTSFFSRKSVDSNRFSLDPLPQHTLNQSIQQSNNPTTENQKFCTSRIASLLRNYVRLLWAVKVDVKPCPLPRVPHYIPQQLPQPMNINR